MSAQEEWKNIYSSRGEWYAARFWMLKIRREAALERRIVALERTIKANDNRTGELERMLKLYFDGLPTGPAGYTSWPVAPLHDQARNLINRNETR